MFQSNTPKQNLKPYVTQGFMHGSQKQNLQQMMVGKQLGEHNPSTPQKFSIMKNIKVLNIPSNSGQDSSFRSSSQKKLLTTESPVIHHQNKENGYLTKRISTDQSLIENQVNSLIQENKKLNEMIQRQFKEKQELIAIIEKQKTDSNQQNTSFDLPNLRERIDRLEEIIDQQCDEIMEWKQKYKQVCEQEERTQAFDQMENQIMKVVEENERLNNLLEERDRQIEQISQDYEQAKSKQNEYCDKINESNQIMMAYNEEIERYKNQINEDEEKIENLMKQLQDFESSAVSQLNSSTIQSDRTSPKDQFQLLEILQQLEQQISELSTQYTYQMLENQKIMRQNNALKDEVNQQQKLIDELKGNNKGLAVNPKFQEASKMIKVIRDKLVKNIVKQ